MEFLKGSTLILLVIALNDLVASQGAGMGSEMGGRAGAGMGVGMDASMGVGAGVGGKANGGMSGGAGGGGGGQGMGPPKRPFHGGNNRGLIKREVMDTQHPYAVRSKRSAMNYGPETETLNGELFGETSYDQHENVNYNFYNEQFPQRFKRHTLPIMPRTKNDQQMQNFKANSQLGVIKQYGSIEEIFNEKVIFQMRSKRSPENSDEEVQLESIDEDNSSSSSSDEDNENEDELKNNRRRRYAQLMHGRNDKFHNFKYDQPANFLSKNYPILTIRKENSIQKSFGQVVE